MFDIGFAELVIIAVVALIVIGPERLPDAVRTASAWLNRLRRGFNEIKQEVQQELHNDAVLRELRESGEKLKRETQSLEQDLRRPLEATDAELRAEAARHLGAGTGTGTDTPGNTQERVQESPRDPSGEDSAAHPGDSPAGTSSNADGTDDAGHRDDDSR